MSVTPQLYYKLCVVEGVCLAFGLGIPFLLHPVTHTSESGLPELVAFVMTFFGTWGLLTAGTGIVFLGYLREHLGAAPARLYHSGVDTPAPAMKMSSVTASGSSSSPRPELTLVRDEDDEPPVGGSSDWKSNWRRRSAPAEKTFPIKTGSE